MTEERTQDDVAKELFDEPYHRLSAWGQRKVDEAMIVTLPLQGSLPGDSKYATLRENERLAQELRNAQRECVELWDEVTELKGQLAQIQAALNLPSTS